MYTFLIVLGVILAITIFFIIPFIIEMRAEIKFHNDRKERNNKLLKIIEDKEKE